MLKLESAPVDTRTPVRYSLLGGRRQHTVCPQLPGTTYGGYMADQAVASYLNASAVREPALSLGETGAPVARIVTGDARRLPLPDATVDLVVTSPPYWRKRDYGIEGQIGQEATPDAYVDQLALALREWRRVLRPTGSVLLNIGDSFWKRSLAGIPGRIENAARTDGWCVRNRIMWCKDAGMPDPAKDRLVNRYEYILHLTLQPHRYYYDLLGYAESYGNGANPGDVWHISRGRRMDGHLAPFPEELVARSVTLASPEAVCSTCGEPRRRIVRRTAQLNPARPQARRALELAQLTGLTDEHIAAVQATGVCDAGQARRVQVGTDRNSARVRALAAEAKKALGGYFREFTFAKRETVGWTSCECGSPTMRGVVLDPFMGSGTTLRVATRLNRDAIGVDLVPGTPN